MAYAGSEHSNQLNAQIGLELPKSDNLLSWNKHLITYDKNQNQHQNNKL